MDGNGKARVLAEQASGTGRQPEFGHGYRRGDWPGPLEEACGPAQHDLGLLHSQVPGHDWGVWCCLTGAENYFAACSCGWRSAETGYVSPALGQVQDHLDAVRAMRGWGRAFPDVRAPHRDGQERDAGQHDMGAAERARELCASLEGQQQRLAQAVGHCSDVLAASAELADRRVAALEREAARAEPERVTGSAPRAAALKRGLERAKELREGIASASAAMAVVAEEIDWIHQDPETRHDKAADWIYGERLMQPTEAKSSSGKAHDK